MLIIAINILNQGGINMATPKFCSHCGNPLPPGSVFCPKCGTKVILPVEEEKPVEEEIIKEEIPPKQEEPVKEVEVQPEEKEEAPVIEEPKIEEPVVEEVKEEEPVIEETKEEIIEEEPVKEEIPEEEVKEELPPKEEQPEEKEPVVEEPEVKEPATEEQPSQPIKNSEPSLAKTILMMGGAYIFGHIEPTKQEIEKDEGDDLLEPRKKYTQFLKKEHEENTIAYFDDLVKQSGVDIDENRRTISERNKLAASKAVLDKKVGKANKTPLIGLGAILSGLALGTLMVMGILAYTGAEIWPAQYNPLVLIVACVLLGIGIIMIIAGAIHIKRVKKSLQPKIDALQSKMDEKEAEARAQMEPLNRLFDFNILNVLLRKTTPLIRVDDHPDMKKVEALMNKFGWDHDMGRYNSTMYMKTGSIKGNPFLLYKCRKERTVNQTYTGTLTITWTKKVTIGKTTTYMPMTQVLTASVVKPRPDYYDDCEFVYGSEAAPDLSFSRHPMIKDYTEKGLKKLYNEREKYVDKYIKDHPNFTPLGNDEFEDFFDGLDRDNEVQYRLLFTPLAQISMLDIIKNREPFGDHFSFYKRKMVNKITVIGTPNIEHEGDPRLFQGFSYDDMRRNFIDMNGKYFYSMFAQLAPLLAIPLYQQYPTDEYIFKRDKERPFSSDLCEMLSNRFYPRYFAPDGCATSLMLKTDNIRVKDNSVQADIYAYGYQRIAHTEYISKLGGDGYWHDVPVTWYEYIPVQKVTPFVVHETYLNKFEYETVSKEKEYQEIYRAGVRGNDFSFYKGYFTFIKGTNAEYAPSPLNEVIKNTLK